MPPRRHPSLRHLAALTAGTGILCGLAAAAGAGPFATAAHDAVALAAKPVTTASPEPLRADGLFPPAAAPAPLVALTYVTDPPPPPPAPPPPASQAPRSAAPVSDQTSPPEDTPTAPPAPASTPLRVAAATPSPRPTLRPRPSPSSSASPGPWGGDN